MAGPARATRSPFPPEILALSKVMSMPADFGELPWTQQFIRAVPALLEGQHIARVWEYSIAVSAIIRWGQQQEGPLRFLDAGGAGSNFWQVLRAFTEESIIRVDPLLDADPHAGYFNIAATLDAVATTGAPMLHGTVDAITAISVIEHIPDVPSAIGESTDLGRFLLAAHDLLRPGGLLVLTTDYWDADGPDTAHFHWMRERIYNRESLARLDQRILDLGFVRFGPVDRTWHGPQVYDYAMASSVFTKRRA